MHFLEKVAFTIFVPFAAPFAVASVIYDEVTGNDESTTTSNKDEEISKVKKKAQNSKKNFKKEEINNYKCKEKKRLESKYNFVIDFQTDKAVILKDSYSIQNSIDNLSLETSKLEKVIKELETMKNAATR